MSQETQACNTCHITIHLTKPSSLSFLSFHSLTSLPLFHSAEYSLPTISIISSIFLEILSLERRVLHNSSLILPTLGEILLACDIWNRNGALVFMDLEPPFQRFLDDELDVILVEVIPPFGQDTLASSPSAMTLMGAEGSDCFEGLRFVMCDLLYMF